MTATQETAGFIGLPLFTFIWASIVSRGMQFILVGVLFWKFGAPIKVFLERYLAWISAAFVVLVVGGILLAGALVAGTTVMRALNTSTKHPAHAP